MNNEHVITSPLFFNRELSWLSFNERVLQEAADPAVPLYERIKFLAIYSSNLDEFFRVRVAALRSLLRLEKASFKKLGFHPARLLQQIHQTVTAQQERFGSIFRDQILADLRTHGIELKDEHGLDARQAENVAAYFVREVRPHLNPVLLDEGGPHPFLKNQGLYLVCTLSPRPGHASSSDTSPRYGMVEVPSPPLPRFIDVPTERDGHDLIFLDDVIRHNLPALFPGHDVGAAYAVKLSRDAGLYLDEDDFGENLYKAIRASLPRREQGLPTRFLYDEDMPGPQAAFLQSHFGLDEADLVPGGRYHNFHDLFGFPRFGPASLSNPPLPPLPHPNLEAAPSLFGAIAERDQLLHFPYQSFDYIVRFFEEAAHDPAVEQIWVTFYRVASNSAITQALIEAARRGKHVTAFVEVKARFDEATNLKWAERMEEAGVQVVYSMPGIKVHSKVALVERREAGGMRRYGYFGTGNFNEKTARVYADSALLTAHPGMNADLYMLFRYLIGELHEPVFAHLLVAPFALREGLEAMIAREVAEARAGRAAAITVKLNSLEDPDMMLRLAEASQAGVRVRLLCRGICCLRPGLHGLTEGIEALSIVDRFLEHTRLYQFYDRGQQSSYLASADWMTRNLDRRVEVAFPILDPALKQELLTVLGFQLDDNTKARHIDAYQQNERRHGSSSTVRRAQIDTYTYLREKVRRA